jgi:type I restriction enzyme S subunit
MSDLPPGWEWTTLGELGDWYGGGTPSKSNSEYWRDGTIPWLSPKDMGPDILAQTQDKITQSAVANSATRLVPQNSIAIVVRSGILERRLPVAIVPFATTLNQDMRAVVPYQGVDQAWVAYFLRSIERQVLKECSKRGTTVASIDVPSLMRVRVPIAPVSEQRRIIAVLESHLSRLDAGQHAVSSAAIKRGLLEKQILDNTALGLDAYPQDNESLSEIRNAQPRKISYTQLPMLPKSWKWRIAAEACASIECGGTPKAGLMYPNRGDVPFMKVYNLTQRGVVDFTVRPTFIDSSTHEKTLRRSRVLPGDVLTNIVGPPLGKTVVVPDLWPEWNINQAIVAFRAGPDVDPRWLALVLRSPYVLGLLLRTARATAGQFNISLSACRELPLPIPSRSQQSALVEVVRDQLACLDRLTADLGVADRRSATLRQTVLAHAFAGRLVHQSPSDEPASVLLERIRVEQAKHSKPKRARRIRQSETIQEVLL